MSASKSGFQIFEERGKDFHPVTNSVPKHCQRPPFVCFCKGGAELSCLPISYLFHGIGLTNSHKHFVPLKYLAASGAVNADEKK